MAIKTKRTPRRTKAERTTPGWRCLVCSADNVPDQEACVSCSTPRGEPVKPKPARKGRTIADAMRIPETQAEAAAKEAAGGKIPRATPPLAEADSRLIELKSITWRRDNPRTVFDGAVDKVKASLAEVGQLQPITVRQTSPVRFEGWIGECRCRAAKALGWSKILALVYAPTTPEAELVLKRCDENDKRTDLNPIDEARSLKQKLEVYGWRDGQAEPSLRSLAKRVDISEGEVSTRLRLLQLPDEWQKRVIAREITYSQARLLVPWIDRPQVLQQLTKDFRSRGECTTADFEDAVYETVDRLTRACEPGQYYSGQFGKQWRSGTVKFTEKDLETYGAELDIVAVPGGSRHGRSTRRAFNTKRWDELHGNRVAAAEKKAVSRGTGKATRDGDREPTAAELKQRREKQAEVLQTKVWQYKVRWLQKRAAERILTAEGYIGIKLLLYFAMGGDRSGERADDALECIRAAGGKGAKQHYMVDRWESLSTVPTNEKVRDLARQVLHAWLQHEAFGYRCDLDPDDVLLIAAELGVDLAGEWRLARDVLELFTKEQLADLAKEWKVTSTVESHQKRGDQIDALIAFDVGVQDAKRLQAPKILIKANG
jgi:ParB/RepB/Spo0J family partition protein